MGAMVGDISFETRAALVSILEVELDDSAASAALADGINSLPRALTITAIVHHDREAVASEPLRDRAPDSFARSGHEDGSAHRS
jgi:hypothetical protein